MTAWGISLLFAGAAIAVVNHYAPPRSDTVSLAMVMGIIGACAAGLILLASEVRYEPIPRAALAAPSYTPIAGSAVNTKIAEAFALFSEEQD